MMAAPVGEAAADEALEATLPGVEEEREAEAEDEAAADEDLEAEAEEEAAAEEEVEEEATAAEEEAAPEEEATEEAADEAEATAEEAEAAAELEPPERQLSLPLWMVKADEYWLFPAASVMRIVMKVSDC